MRRLINALTSLSLVLYIVPPFAAQAQDFPQVTIDGELVICLPDRQTECPEGALCVLAKNPENCERNATKALDLLAQGQTSELIIAPAGAQSEATAEPNADAAAQTDAEAQAAADAAQAQADAEAQAAADAAQAQADAEAQAAADAAQAQADAEAQAAADAAQAQADADAQAAADAAQAQADADAQAAADAAQAQAAADAQAVADAAQAQADAEAQADADAAAAAEQSAAPADDTAAPAELQQVVIGDQTVICLPDKTTPCPAGNICVVAKNPANCEKNAIKKLDAIAKALAEDAAAAKAQAEADAAAAAAEASTTPPVEAPQPTDEAVSSLESALTIPAEGTEATPVEPVAAAEAPAEEGTLPADQAPPAGAVVTTETVTKADTRSSDQEFAAAPVEVAPGKKSHLSDLEKVGLIALGALVVGAILNDGKQVVSNTGDRVVVQQTDGSYSVYKDDDALLRQPGSTVRTETYGDGSSRTIVVHEDGTQIVTIRDASGRVLRRVAYDQTGHQVVLIDDMRPEEHIDVTTLPQRDPNATRILAGDDAALKARMAALEAEQLGRKFSLRQIRDIPQVRELAATIDVDNITFDTNSAAIKASEAGKLAELGRLIGDMIDANPAEIFLVEGHTDAVGSAASNLALSDRRAESVAKALTEYFDVPPENLVVQGYGESELRIDTQADERANRRVAVRIITPLLRQAE